MRAPWVWGRATVGEQGRELKVHFLKVINSEQIKM